MLKVLLFLARGLAGLTAEVKRIADALDRAHPHPRKGLEPTYEPFDEDAQVAEEERRAAYEQRRHRPLSDEEEVPVAFDDKDRLAKIRAFLENNDHHNRTD